MNRKNLKKRPVKPHAMRSATSEDMDAFRERLIEKACNEQLSEQLEDLINERLKPIIVNV